MTEHCSACGHELSPDIRFVVTTMGKSNANPSLEGQIHVLAIKGNVRDFAIAPTETHARTMALARLNYRLDVEAGLIR